MFIEMMGVRIGECENYHQCGNTSPILPQILILKFRPNDRGWKFLSDHIEGQDVLVDFQTGEAWDCVIKERALARLPLQVDWSAFTT
jgi:hypothetical protein